VVSERQTSREPASGAEDHETSTLTDEKLLALISSYVDPESHTRADWGIGFASRLTAMKDEGPRLPAASDAVTYTPDTPNVPDAAVSPFRPSETDETAPEASARTVANGTVENAGGVTNTDTNPDASTAPELPPRRSGTAAEMLVTDSFDRSGATGGTVSLVNAAPGTTVDD
jgi:hypothetical protein